MENGGNGLFSGNGGSGRGQNSNNVNHSWDIWELGTSRFDWSNNSFNADAVTTTTTTAVAAAAAAAHAIMFPHQGDNAHHHHHLHHYPSLYATAASHVHPDPHLACLKLGKRHYFEDGTPLGERHVPGFPIEKRGRSYDVGVGVGGPSSSTTAAATIAAAGMGSPVAVPRCQVEGCHVALLNAKDYHRRHKVCEMHSKAPKVVVLGIEQRFCQQCSRIGVGFMWYQSSTIQKGVAGGD
uniref:SBP-type domain-containing protein n=1 Tax=Nelumbo nucifera TaxID=4432 RepID=A0A822XF07_NELNU|nr:TPA_asm: hypothetical protein HUJ06_019945 [Nelumbo nucifera]